MILEHCSRESCVQIIEGLKEKYARLHAASCRDDDTIAALREERDKVIAELAAAQARVKSLHEALWKAHGLLAKMNIPMISDALDIVDDTAALDARLAQEREKCAELLLRTDLKNLPDEWKQAAATALQAYATAIREIT
jgi:seryl-tRNA synthetase